MNALLHTYHRYRTLQTHRIAALPVVILMPHSACNCRCAMCDIWKGNHNLKQLTEKDVASLLPALERWGTRRVVMSGGEALLNPNFFRLCQMLRQRRIRITLLSTGLTLKKHAKELVRHVDEVIVSLDGTPEVHDEVRNITGAFRLLREGVAALKSYHPGFRVTARSVIHRLNFRVWPSIIDTAHDAGVDQVSFLPADVSSTAFNRDTPWQQDRQSEIMLSLEELPRLKVQLSYILDHYRHDFESGFIAEAPEKLSKIYTYYSALHGLNPFPFKKCNAPWVSTVIEPDGNVRPCFFHPVLGNVKNESLEHILNGTAAIAFRRKLASEPNEICNRCVCYLNLSPGAKI